jgi:hypothetical protein
MAWQSSSAEEWSALLEQLELLEILPAGHHDDFNLPLTGLFSFVHSAFDFVISLADSLGVSSGGVQVA